MVHRADRARPRSGCFQGVSPRDVLLIDPALKAPGPPRSFVPCCGLISVRMCAPIKFRVLMERSGSADAQAVPEEIERYNAAQVPCGASCGPGSAYRACAGRGR